MNICLYRIAFIAFFLVFSFYSFSQDDLLKMMDSIGTSDNNKINKVTATFKTLKVISLQTAQTVGDGELDFRITHRFGNVGKQSNGGVHTLFGWDAISDVRFSFDYGVTEKLQIGIARNKKSEFIDGSVKWRFFDQTIDNKMPLSMCLYSIASLTPMRKDQLYSGADSSWVANNAKFFHRMVYTTQLIMTRKFAPWLSVALAPGFTHRNYVLARVNSSNNAEDENGIISMAAGFRIKVTRSFSVLADYFYVMSDYRRNNSFYYPPLAVGIEIETGGHVFHLNLTNAAGITENYLIPNSSDAWSRGGYKFGFNISRVFQICSKKK